MTMQRLIGIINDLLEKYHLGRIDETKHVFIEPELAPRIKELFESRKEVIEKYSVEIKKLFKRIICMEKSTGAFLFYDFLRDSKLSFANGLFMYALDHEPYYNNNDMVFFYYLTTSSRGTSVEKAVEYYTKNIDALGHYFYYAAKFERAYKLRLNFPQKNPNKISLRKKIIHFLKNKLWKEDELKIKSKVPNIPDDIKRKIIHSVKKNKFFHTNMKALMAAIYFDIKEVIPCVEDMFQASSLKLVNTNIPAIMKTGSTDYDFSQWIEDVLELAIALYFLTGDFKYKKLYDSVNNKDRLDTAKNDEIRPVFENMVHSLKEYLK